MAERLGSGLQIRLQRFNSASHLQRNPEKSGLFFFYPRVQELRWYRRSHCLRQLGFASADRTKCAPQTFRISSLRSTPLTGVNKKVKIYPVMGSLSEQLCTIAYSAAYATGRERIHETRHGYPLYVSESRCDALAGLRESIVK